MRPVAWYEGLYSVTLCGKVWTHRKGRWLKPNKDSSGYLQVSLTKEGIRTQTLLHRVVAMSYLPPPEDFMTVDHKDNNPLNNSVNNLQWMSVEDNILKDQSKVVWFESPEGEVVKFEGLSKTCESLGLDPSAMSKVSRGINKQHKGWKYIDSTYTFT